MAILNLSAIAADISADRTEKAIWKARKAIESYAGLYLNDKGRARLAEDIVDYIAEAEPQNAPAPVVTMAMIMKGHKCSEYVVRKMIDEIIEKGVPYIIARKSEPDAAIG